MSSFVHIRFSVKICIKNENWVYGRPSVTADERPLTLAKSGVDKSHAIVRVDFVTEFDSVPACL